MHKIPQLAIGELDRRQFIARAVAAGGVTTSILSKSVEAADRPADPKPVKAFCVDFNWGPRGASPPGMYAQADPAQHVKWYQELGANTIQTFCVSYNGYAWYPSRVAPVTPGLAHPNFLGDMVNLGHKAGMKVMGYFTLGANPYWEKRHPDRVHGADSDYIKIPMTLEYLNYFCRSMKDAIERTGVDGFMIDWVRPTQHKRWLDCEKAMYGELLHEQFPKSGSLPKEAALEFDKRAMARAWKHIKQTVEATRRVTVWTNHPFKKDEYSLWQGQRLLQEVDWVLNESHDLGHLGWLRKQVGPKTLIVQNLCGWKGHDATAWKKIDTSVFGLYGFAKADPKTTLPTKKLAWNIKNIGILRKAYHSL